MTAERLSRIDDLEDHEQLALGALIRVLVRLDGSFSEEEEAQIEGVAAELGSVEQLWHLVSRSAQELRTDDDIRGHAREVVRPGAQALIRDALESIARAGTITFGAFGAVWGEGPPLPPISDDSLRARGALRSPSSIEPAEQALLDWLDEAWRA